MIIRGRVRPIAIIGALVIMIASLLYVALNRSHEVGPASPMHQTRKPRTGAHGQKPFWARLLSV